MDKKKLDEQFEEIEKSLADVKDNTTVVAKNVEEQTAHVKESLEGMTGVLDGMKTNDEKREQELSGLKSDIENIKNMIPQVKSIHCFVIPYLMTNCIMKARVCR